MMKTPTGHYYRWNEDLASEREAMEGFVEGEAKCVPVWYSLRMVGQEIASGRKRDGEWNGSRLYA